MKHILIPVDFSDESWKAALSALSMCQNAGVCFYLFYSEISDAFDADQTTIYLTREKDLQSWLVKLKSKITRGQVIIPLRWEANFIDSIRAAVSDNKIDLIVLSVQYSNIFRDGVNGSHTRDIITRVKCVKRAMLSRIFKT